MKKNPIYLFYEVVAYEPDGTPGDDGDVHYQCFHGAHKICTIKKSMRGNRNGVVSFHSLLPDQLNKALRPSQSQCIAHSLAVQWRHCVTILGHVHSGYLFLFPFPLLLAHCHGLLFRLGLVVDS